MAKYIFITGGVVSGLGKGITAASLGRLLKARGLKVALQKFDPYLNVDPGTIRAMCRDGRLMATAADGHAPLILVRSMASMVEDKTAEQPRVKAARRHKYDDCKYKVQ